jgi:hypothetical protein
MTRSNGQGRSQSILRSTVLITSRVQHSGVPPTLTLPFSQSGQRRTDHDVDPMVREDPKASSDLWFSSLHKFNVQGFHPFNTPFLPEWSTPVDPMVREDPEYPQIYGSRYFMTGSGSGFNGGTDPTVTVKETTRCRSTSLVTIPTGFLRLVLKVVKS